MAKSKVNLFIYGSLREPAIFKSVCNLFFTQKPDRLDRQTLLACPALLPRYRKVSPDNVYFYAVADPSAKIEGLVIYDIPFGAIEEIDRYEGKRYDRETIHVNTAKGLVDAQAYLASHEAMRKHFGDRFHVNLIHELWLRKRIKKFIRKHTRPGERTVDANLERLAKRELLGTTERDLVMSHYGSDAVSDYYLEHELDRPRPSIKPLYDDTQAQPFIENYLALAVKQVLLNQLEERIHAEYRFEIERIRSSERYFKRSVSLLIALQMINANSSSVDLIINKALGAMPYKGHDLVDYVKYAVRAAKSIFDNRVVRAHLERIRSNFNPGLIPLGAEIELSNLGPDTIQPQKGSLKKVDPVFDGFRYFHDFQLHVLTWKLGGYIDDHSGSTQYQRRLGFFELAPGRLNVTSELSKPATADPWLLNQLISAIVFFYNNVRPHSLHLSFQLRKNQIGKQKILPLGFVKCLLALGGGLQRQHTGRLWISRMGYDEIIHGEELVFARTSKRNWYLGKDDIAEKIPAQATTHIQQYKFIRLEERASYEPLILCLKGLQIAYNPADYITAEQLRESTKLREEYEELKKWAVAPNEISLQTITRFLSVMQQGLMTENRKNPVHKLHYIDWAVSAIETRLRMFNKHLKESQTTLL